MPAIDPFSSARKQDPQAATRQINKGGEGGTSSKQGKAQPSATSNAFLSLVQVKKALPLLDFDSNPSQGTTAKAKKKKSLLLLRSKA
jgi:hypothetical protein